MKGIQPTPEPSRCSWVNLRNPVYVRYHDEEWGRPLDDDGNLFEMLFLETFQAGLSWECILNKREAFRKAFNAFDAQAIAAYETAKVDALLQTPGIVRNRAKIQSTIRNARCFLDIQQDHGSFSNYLWSWTDGRILREMGQTTSPLSEALSRDLRQKGMTFVGPTTIYAFLQAVGVINAHEDRCFRCVESNGCEAE